MLKEKSRPLSLSELIRLSDDALINRVNPKTSFTYLGRKRRFKYRTTNESIEKWKHLIIRPGDKALLVVSGSGMLSFELLASYHSSRPPLIVGLDYSPKQIGYNFLLKSMVRNYKWKTFLKYIHHSTPIQTKALLADIPEQYRKFVPRRHHFGKRDTVINLHNGLSWFHKKSQYMRVQKNIDQLKFFEYELSHHNPTLPRLFVPHCFNTVYLSNTLDWLSWHNPDIRSVSPMLEVYHQISTLLAKNGRIVFSHLRTRPSYVVQLVQRIRIEEAIQLKTYKYHWTYYKAYGK